MAYMYTHVLEDDHLGWITHHGGGGSSLEETDSLSSCLLPVALHLRPGACEISSVHAGMLPGVLLCRTLLAAILWRFHGCSFPGMSRKHCPAVARGGSGIYVLTIKL